MTDATYAKTPSHTTLAEGRVPVVSDRIVPNNRSDLARIVRKTPVERADDRAAKTVAEDTRNEVELWIAQEYLRRREQRNNAQ